MYNIWQDKDIYKIYICILYTRIKSILSEYIQKYKNVYKIYI